MFVWFVLYVEFALFVMFVAIALFVFVSASGHKLALLGNESSFRFVASSTALDAARESSFHWEGLFFFSFFCFVSSLFAVLIPPFSLLSASLSAPAPRKKQH